jgi:hypothetical protein
VPSSVNASAYVTPEDTSAMPHAGRIDVGASPCGASLFRNVRAVRATIGSAPFKR